MIRNLYEVLADVVDETSIKQMYSAEDLVDRDQLEKDALGEFGRLALGEKRSVKVINPKTLKAWGGEDLATTFAHSKPWQKKLVATYKKNEPKSPKNIIIVDGDMIVDGHHRAMAALLAGRTIQCIDLGDDLSEAEKEKPKAKPIPHEEPILTVKLVDGKKTRDTIAVDFIGGGHYFAYPDLIPKGEVWIEQDLAPDEQTDILVHELIEYALMKQGMTYTPAHNMANKLEKVFRGFEGRWKTKQAPDGDKKVEESLLVESYNRALPHFIKYLNGGVDPYDFTHLLAEFFEDEGIKTPEGFDEDEPYEFLDTPEFEAMKDQFTGWLHKRVMEDGSHFDATMPTYLFMSGAKLVPRQTWLIHFSDNASDIATNGFRFGAEDFTALGLTTHFGDKVRKKGPGWNFAFKANDRRGVIGGIKKYGKEAVVFQSGGVEAFHDGDNESQVVFWGPNVKERFYIHSDGGEWQVKNPATDRILATGKLMDMIGWIQQNHAQYAKVITNDIPQKPIQPTPKADREKLLAKTPEKIPQPFESVAEETVSKNKIERLKTKGFFKGGKTEKTVAINYDAWIDRDGNYYPVHGEGHQEAAEIIAGKTESQLEKAGWCKVSNNAIFAGDNFHFTDGQRAVLQVWRKVWGEGVSLPTMGGDLYKEWTGQDHHLTSEDEAETPKGVCPKCGLAKHSAIPHLCPKGRSKWGAKGGKFTTPERPRFKEKIAESTEEDLLVVVNQFASNKHPDDHVPEDYRWARDKAFNTEGLIHMMPGGLAGWRSFLGDAVKESPDKYAKLSKTEKIDDPVILSPGHIWDGWHRIAAAIVNGHKTIPAIVGKLHAR